MVSINKKAPQKSSTATTRNSDERLVDQLGQAYLVEREAQERRARLEAPPALKKYASKLQLLNKLDADFRGVIAHKPFRSEQLRVDSNGELTHSRGLIKKKKKVFIRDQTTGSLRLIHYERSDWNSVRRYDYDQNGVLSEKHIKSKAGAFEEKWERDENGELMRTRYIDRRRLTGRALHPISEEIGRPYESGLEKRLYRVLTRREGSQQKTFERDDKGNLELIESKRMGYSMSSQKAPDRQTSRTSIRKLGGAFSESYRSRLDKDGHELGRDVSAHRSLLNKRSAVYDDATGELKSSKHTFGKIYKAEATYLNAEIKEVSKKILGVTVGKELKTLSGRELEAQVLRAAERALHKQAWQHPSANPSRSQRENTNSHLGNELDGPLESDMTVVHQAGSGFVGDDRHVHDGGGSRLNELHESRSSNDRENLSSPRAEICDRSMNRDRTGSGTLSR
ncbi:hypothetical protein EXN32_11450 [Agrobacterium tumefaciens]|uniref:Riorf173 protein n=2 Tax=Rhizobium/Agrobacterium group TaxID=227290 RepID=Q9F582_RHIRH|nr:MULTISPECIES: hypothetical protein [Rhizobium/Agrobacterium group]ASK42889.1 hypothetical protein [Rhizobium rhizogenes]MCZ7976397.1 hypothetical protein [Agrobacterium salinitolerans]MDA5243285.1 hypothetical protein [Agrobacterium sp. MAFF310724]MDA5247533.1 hypothetical protein [Agrobacterium sp. MAFF210268]TRB03215.1 hypothetical protein EXN61_23065 [Agrobacterium tumefaciens]